MTAPISGQTTVTTAGTEVVLGTGTGKGPQAVRALSTNTGYMYLGNDGSGAVSSSSGYQLAAGDQIIVESVENIGLGDKGVKLTWKNETHFVLLDTTEREVNADGIQAKAACLRVKVSDPQNFSLCLPAGGQATFRSQKLEGAGPRELAVVEGKARPLSGTDLIKEAR